MANAWVEHVKQFAKKNGITYGCVISNAECKNSYVSPTKIKKPKEIKKQEPPKIQQQPAKQEAPKSQEPLKIQQPEQGIIKEVDCMLPKLDKNEHRIIVQVRATRTQRHKGLLFKDLYMNDSDVTERFALDYIKNHYDKIKENAKTYNLSIVPFKDLKINFERQPGFSGLENTWNMPKISRGRR